MTDSERIRALRGDDWNLDHIAKHGMEPDDATDVVWGRPMIEPSYKGRLQCIGPNVAGRILAVIIGPVPDEPGGYYVFSARPAHRKERRIYFDQKGRSSL